MNISTHSDDGGLSVIVLGLRSLSIQRGFGIARSAYAADIYHRWAPRDCVCKVLDDWANSHVSMHGAMRNYLCIYRCSFGARILGSGQAV